MADYGWIDRAEHAFYKTYNRLPVVFDHGEGVNLYDNQGNEYLDFGAGIAVMALGYGDEEYTKAVEKQLHKLTHSSNLFYNQPSIEAGEGLLKLSGMERVFFTNSGTEAIEGALKIARRYYYNKSCEAAGADGCQEKEPAMMVASCRQPSTVNVVLKQSENSSTNLIDPPCHKRRRRTRRNNFREVSFVRFSQLFVIKIFRYVCQQELTVAYLLCLSENA